MSPGEDSYRDSINSGSAYDAGIHLLRKVLLQYAPHFVSRGQIVTALEDRTLANVSWVIPSDKLSDWLIAIAGIQQN